MPKTTKAIYIYFSFFFFFILDSIILKIQGSVLVTAIARILEKCHKKLWSSSPLALPSDLIIMQDFNLYKDLEPFIHYFSFPKGGGGVWKMLTMADKKGGIWV